ncbi:hypothetical protein [Singulisphaera sp. PoT]|uniref:hypothetical protein n=1 Tax=Singulisphaera sp. PoT TaxID=3411797 RepID=UPI003BF471A3
MQPRLRRWPFAVVGALVLALTGAVSAAPPKPPIEVENLRVGYSNKDQNNLFKVGAWTPVWVQLRAGDQRFTGVMELTVPDDDGTPTLVQQPIDVGAGESQRFTVYARPGSNDPDFGIRLIDASRKVRPITVVGSNVAKFDPLRSDDSLVLVLGKPQGVDMVPALPGFADKNMGGQVAVARVEAAEGLMPGRWQGFDGARAIVLDTDDREVMATLDNLRGRALADWVSRGGHLVVSVGSNWQQVRDSVIGPLLPAVPSGQERVNDLNGIETFTAGATKPITPAGTPPVMVTKFESIESRGGKVLGSTLGVPLIIRGTHGFGRVTLIGVDVDQKPFSSWEDRALFWVRALDLRRQGNESANGTVTATAPSRRIYQASDTDLSTELRRGLEQFKGIKLISFGWVAFFIFLYILLIGPGDYLFLKKVVKRMELTWITFPVIVLTVSLLAYYAAYVVKGSDLRVNKVDIIDVLQGPGPDNAVPSGGLIRGTSFVDIFSPQNRDYGVSVVPLPVDQDAPKGDAAPSKAPAGTETVLSWFGVPQPGFGGMGNSRQIGFSSGGYAYSPPGSAESLTDVRVAIWSTKCLMARWFGPGPSTPLFDVDLKPVGSDRLEGTITNRSGMTLEDTILAFNKQVYILNKIAPGATVQVELANDRQLSGHLQAQPVREGNVQAWNTEAPILRANLMLQLMFHDSAASSATTAENPTSSNPLHTLDLTGVLNLDRPMLVARIDRPTSRLLIDNAPSEPKVDQTTLLRVLLPLKKPGDEASKGN